MNKEDLKKLVEEDDKDKRMEIAESIETGGNEKVTELETQIETLKSENETLSNSLEDEKTKYRERFFSGDGNNNNNSNNEPNEESPKTLTQILGGMENG